MKPKSSADWNVQTDGDVFFAVRITTENSYLALGRGAGVTDV